MPQTMTADDINLLSMCERRILLRTLGTDCWDPIDVMCEFFSDHDMGRPNSWISWVNAGVLEHIYQGVVAESHGQPHLWINYLSRHRNGDPSAAAWSIAKQAADDHGLMIARRKGTHPTPIELAFLAIAQSYNHTLRMEGAIMANRDALRMGCEIALENAREMVLESV